MLSFHFLLYSLLLPLLTLFFFSVLRRRTPSSSKTKPLPPGPKPWPIIGNLLDVGKKPHLSLTHFSNLYGPLISLRIGTTLNIVASSPAAAKEILKTHDRLLSARYVPQIHPMNRADCDRLSLIWATKCTDEWKFLRNLCSNELFSAKAIESQAGLREKKVSELLSYIAENEGKVVNIGDLAFTMIFNVLGNLLFSRDFIGWEDEMTGTGMKGLVWKALKLSTTPNVYELYPVLRRFDIQGLRKKYKNCFNQMYAIWEDLVRERRSSKQSSPTSTQRDFLDVFLAHGFSDEQINLLAGEIFPAGAEASSTAVEWAMAELIRNKECMEKLREELSRELKGTSTIKESHISQLPYLNACVKETFRLHPSVPFLLPHRAPETMEILNYTIPKNSSIAVNIWAIGRDPEIWDDPLKFKPERFLDSNMDFRGQFYEFLPFGSGRRICPGMPMANVQVNLILASLIHNFQWFLPSDNDDPSKMDMSDKFGLTLRMEKSLMLIPKRAI